MKKFALPLLLLGLSLFWPIPPAAVALDLASAYVSIDAGGETIAKYGFGHHTYTEAGIEPVLEVPYELNVVAALTGGIMPKIYLWERTEGYVGASCDANIDWVFCLKKFWPTAPDDIDVPIIISYNVKLSASPGSASCWATAWGVYYRRGTGNWLFDLDTKKNQVGLSGTLSGSGKPLEQQGLSIWADTYCYFYEGTCIASVSIDPEVIIDPTFTVNINGVDYPANQLYTVELSPNLFRSPALPSPAPWLNLLLGD